MNVESNLEETQTLFSSEQEGLSRIVSAVNNSLPGHPYVGTDRAFVSFVDQILLQKSFDLSDSKLKDISRPTNSMENDLGSLVDTDKVAEFLSGANIVQSNLGAAIAITVSETSLSDATSSSGRSVTTTGDLSVTVSTGQ